MSAQNIKKQINTALDYDDNNCNLNLSMTSPQRTKHTLGFASTNDRPTLLERLMQNHSDPYPTCYLPSQHTDNDEGLYEFQLMEPKFQRTQQQSEKTASDSKKNIELTLILTTQNDQLASKIKEVRELLNSQQLKSNIFKRKHQENQKKIAQLKEKKEKLNQEGEKIKTLNESSIPNKSIQLNTTGNTNAWLNEFLNKSQLQNLWSKQKDKQAKNAETKVKSYTIDLSTFMNSARLKNEKISDKTKCFEQKVKTKAPTKVLTTRPLSSKPNHKVELSEKQRTLNKNLSQLRNMKKNKCNPQL